MLKVCKACGRAFRTLNATKFCSAYCRAKYQSSTRTTDYCKQDETICWTCQNALGGCSWSKTFKPVEGWKAERKDIKNRTGKMTTYTESYKVISCPEYIEDEPRGR